MLKVFFGADPLPLIDTETARHRELLAFFERMRERDDIQPGPRRALETGLRYHRFWIDTWERMRRDVEDGG